MGHCHCERQRDATARQKAPVNGGEGGLTGRGGGGRPLLQPQRGSGSRRCLGVVPVNGKGVRLFGSLQGANCTKSLWVWVLMRHGLEAQGEGGGWGESRGWPTILAVACVWTGAWARLRCAVLTARANGTGRLACGLDWTELGVISATGVSAPHGDTGRVLEICLTHTCAHTLGASNLGQRLTRRPPAHSAGWRCPTAPQPSGTR